MSDEKTSKKPLKSTVNKKIDLQNTYGKNENNVRNIPIVDSESDEAAKMKAGGEFSGDNAPGGDNESESQAQSGNQPGQMDEDYKSIINKLMDERDDLKDQLMRKAAELENVRKRSLKEKMDMIDYANEKLLFNMLEILDNIESAVDAGSKSSDYDSLLKGVELIKQKAVKLFEDAGVKQMESYVGKPFDVNFHEALMMIPSDLPEETVVQEIQKGYMIQDKVLRHTKVITSAGKKE